MNKIKSLYLALCLLVLSAVPALAVLSTDQQAVVTQVEGQIADFSTMMWGLVLLVMGSIVGVKLFKKFFAKGV